MRTCRALSNGLFVRSHVPTWCYAAVIQGYHMLSPFPAGVDMILTIASLLHSMNISGFKKFQNSKRFIMFQGVFGIFWYGLCSD